MSVCDDVLKNLKKENPKISIKTDKGSFVTTYTISLNDENICDVTYKKTMSGYKFFINSSDGLRSFYKEEFFKAYDYIEKLINYAKKTFKESCYHKDKSKMLLSEAKEVLKKNGYRLVESMEASYESVNTICAKNGFEVIDSDVDPDTWVIYQKGWEDEIEEAPGFSNLINDLEELDGFKWLNDDTDRSAIVCWNSHLA